VLNRIKNNEKIGNVYPVEDGAYVMGRASVIVALIVLIVPLGAFSTVATAQTNIIPEINISCDDPAEIDVYPGSTMTTIIDCVLENPTIHQEKIEVTIESGTFAAAGPSSMTVGSGSEVSFQVIVRADESHSADSYLVNISAQVVEANGIQVSLFTSPEYSEVTVVVNAFMSCDWTMGQGGGAVEAGDVIAFSASFTCTGNDDSSANFSPRMISDSGDNSWPSGFVDQSAPCNLQTQSGSSSTNCQFQILTPANLGETWEGCIAIWWEEDWLGYVPDSCEYERVDVKVEPKGIGLDTLGLDGNESISEILQENKQIVAGGGGVLLLAFVAVALLRRSRRDSYDD